MRDQKILLKRCSKEVDKENILMCNKNKAFAAGIVSYNPDIKRFKENIDSILSQVDKLIIIENG